MHPIEVSIEYIHLIELKKLADTVPKGVSHASNHKMDGIASKLGTRRR